MKNSINTWKVFPYKHFLGVFIGIIFALNGLGQGQSSFHFDNLTRERGLIQSNISTIASDHKGFLWLGSSDGLYKWDGLSLMAYRDQNVDSLSLSDPNITALYEDPDSSGLWIGTTFGGLNYLKYATNHFHSWLTVNQANNRGSYHLNDIRAIKRLNDSILIAGTLSRGLFRLHLSGNNILKAERIHNEQTGTNYRVFAFAKTGKSIYVGTSRGLFILTEQGKVTHYTPGLLSVQKHQVKDFALMDSGKLIMATHNDLWRWQPDKMKATRLLTDRPIHEITELAISSRPNNLWIGTLKDGLYYIDLEQEKIIHHAVSGNPAADNTIVHNQISDLLFYPKQPILMAATPAGVSSIDFGRILFNSYDLRKWSDANNTNVFFNMEDSHDRLWFWSFTGLFRQDKHDETFKKILDSNYGNRQNLVRDGTETGNGTLWFATSNGLLEMSVADDRQIWHHFEHPALPDDQLNEITSLQKDQAGNIWLASRVATIRYNLRKKESRIYPFPLSHWQQSSIDVTDIVINPKESTCWIGTKGPWLIQLNTRSGKYQRINSTPDTMKDKSNTVSNYILSMDLDENNRLWLATYGSGLLFLDKETMRLRDDYAINSLAGNTYGVRHAEDDHIWVSTDYGITRLNPETKALNEFGLKEGTFCQEFNERAIYETDDGYLLMGGTNGFVRFHPQKIQLNSYVPPVYISSYFPGRPGVTTGRKHQREAFPVRSKQIEIPYSQEVIAFETSVLNLRHPAKNRIAWKLEGHDQEWSEAPASHIITYSNLSPGNYRLRVKGSNNHGVWNHKGDYLDIYIQAPFYQHPSFPWIMGIFIIGLGMFAFWLRTKILKRQKNLLSQLVRDRTQNLQKAYQELEASRKKVMEQNKELAMHRNKLENLVASRTEDLERAKEKAEEADRLKTSFLANLSHEIRTPMNAIVGFSTLLSNMDLSEEDKDDFVKMIQQSGENLLTLINDIIDISRIETGQIKIYPEAFNLEAFLNDIIKSLTFDPAQKEKIELILNFPEDLKDFNLYTDKQRLRQVIVNLISNALKFTAEGHVALSVGKMTGSNMIHFVPDFSIHEVTGELILFTVEDTGIGISQQSQNNIFEPFRKADNHDNPRYGGMGLGLSIVKSILPVLGGDITFKSQPGVGTTFYFYVPATNDR